MIQDFHVGADGMSLTTSTSGPVSYLGPAPPETLPHKYTELLFVQAPGFDVPPSQVSVTQSRAGFDLTGFAAAVGLGEPIASNWFHVIA